MFARSIEEDGFLEGHETRSKVVIIKGLGCKQRGLLETFRKNPA